MTKEPEPENKKEQKENTAYVVNFSQQKELEELLEEFL